GRVQFWLLFVGFNLTFFPQHYLGVIGMPRRIYTYGPGRGWEFWNLMSTVGAFGIALSILLFLVNAVRSLRHGPPAPADPCDGRTLEWRTWAPPSPWWAGGRSRSSTTAIRPTWTRSAASASITASWPCGPSSAPSACSSAP